MELTQEVLDKVMAEAKAKGAKSMREVFCKKCLEVDNKGNFVSGKPRQNGSSRCEDCSKVYADGGGK